MKLARHDPCRMAQVKPDRDSSLGRLGRESLHIQKLARGVHHRGQED